MQMSSWKIIAWLDFAVGLDIAEGLDVATELDVILLTYLTSLKFILGQV